MLMNPASPEGSPKPPLAPSLATDEKKKILQAYRQVLMCVFVATLVTIVVLVLIFLLSKSLSIFAFVIGAGVLGALFSSLMRLYNYEDLPKALIGGGLGLEDVWLVMYALVPLIVGAISAAALYLAFMSGLLQGDLFPMFECHDLAEHSCKSLEEFADKFAPRGPEQYAKAIVWGFIAGFAERLVPDLLKNIAGKATKPEAGR
jgi:hypothetical protein